MTDKKEAPANKKYTPDWFVQGVLTKIGEAFDKFTGRNWKPSSSLATSELIERLKRLLDAEVREDGSGRFVPHNIKLKTQWDKFSIDSEDGIKKLENELLTAAVDHINDNRYHTYAPIKVEIKPDYFTEGVKLQASFGEFAVEEDDEQQAEVNVTVPQIKVGEFIPPEPEAPKEPEKESFTAEFIENEKQKSVELEFIRGERSSVGRTKENDLNIDDISISKNHATLMLSAEGKLLVADTGSTNGTFINGERIAYGRAFMINEGDKLKFGSVEVFIRRAPEAAPFVSESDVKTEVLEKDSLPAEVFRGNEENEKKNPFSENYSPQNPIGLEQPDESFTASNGEAGENSENGEAENTAVKATQQRINLDFGGDKS